MCRFDALGRSAAWMPHTPNIPGAERAVYDPLAHTTTVYTFSSSAVQRQEEKGDGLLRKKHEGMLAREAPWHGRRKARHALAPRLSFALADSALASSGRG